MPTNYKANQRLWSIKKDQTGYYYEIRLAGTVMAIRYLSDKEETSYRELGLIK